MNFGRFGGDGESFLHSSFPIILINFNTKDAFFFFAPPPPGVRKKNGGKRAAIERRRAEVRAGGGEVEGLSGA